MSNYFSKLNYSLSNEDSRVERKYAQLYSSILAVGGSGSRAFSLIHDKLEKLIIIDISEPQIQYARFKLELFRQLSYSDYLKFMGYQNASFSERNEITTRVKLSTEAHNYVRSIPKKFVEKGLIYSGRWESILIRIGRLITSLTMHNFRRNFLAEANKEALWPGRRLKVLIKLLANQTILNLFLYRGQMVKSMDINMVDFLYNNFKSCFLDSDAKDSFFHQMLFLGRIEFSSGLPIDVTEDVFNQIKNFQGSIEFYQMDLTQAIRKFNFQFGSFSNVPSYFTDSQNQDFEQELARSFENGASSVVIRSFLKHREVIHPDLKLKLNQKNSRHAQQMDSTGLYRFQILEKL